MPAPSPDLRALRSAADATSIDLVKVHLKSRKVTILLYDGFRSPNPLLMERIKVDLAKLRVDCFDYLATGERL